MYSVQTIILVAFTVSCLMPFTDATWSKKTTTPSLPPDMVLQMLVSRMMSKYPQNATKDLLGGRLEGVDNGPNLGYDPYWVNLPDRDWEQKCHRCPEIFRRYEEVCASDGTGDIYVNISLCDMMRQNCVGGFAHGNTTGSRSDYENNVFVVQNGWARISLRQDQDAHVILSNTAKIKPPFYKIILDGWGATKTQVFKNDGYYPMTTYTNYYHWDRPLGKESEFIEFVIRWNTTSGWILFTKSSYTNWTDGFALNWTDPDPFPIKFMTISSYGTYKGEWIMRDLPTGFVVTNLGPCADMAQSRLPRTLPTNPTHVPPIIESYSTFNKGYYTRLYEADIDPGKVPFGTREEY